jgi:hypothetical protein
MTDQTYRLTDDSGTHCEKPGCGKLTEVYDSRWCAGCWYPGIDRDYETYRESRKEGYSRYQAMLMAGWADPDE